MKYFVLLVCVLVPLCTSDLVLDSDGWLMQDLHDENFDSIRVRRQAPQHQQHQQQEPLPQYRPYSQAPAQIKQLLQFQQARDPVVNIPAAPVPNFGSGRPAEPRLQTQNQAGGYQPHVQYGNAPQQPTYQNHAAAVAAQYRPQGQHQGQPAQHAQYNQQQPQYQPQGQQPQYNQGQYQG